MNRSIAAFESLIDHYAGYLSNKGIQFNPQGFPILQPQMYLAEMAKAHGAISRP